MRVDYNTSKTERANEVYRGLTEILKILLAEAILCPNVEELNSDFVTALVLLIQYARRPLPSIPVCSPEPRSYKPVQHMAFYSRGIYDLGRIVHASKVSPFSSMSESRLLFLLVLPPSFTSFVAVLHALMHRTASFISLPNSPQVFIAAFASQAPVPPQVVSNLRLWLWLCFSDSTPNKSPQSQTFLILPC